MGGHAAGEVAATLATRVAAEELTTKRARRIVSRYAESPELEHRRAIFQLLEGAVAAANEAVIADGVSHEAHRGMGTTLDLALVVRDRAFFAHVGDARAYLVRPTATLQLTHDHAAYDSLRSSGKRNASPRSSRSPLTNSIGAKRRAVVDSLFVDLSSGDRIVLCTDGVFHAMDSEAHFATLCRRGTAEEVCTALLDVAYRTGGGDDASAIVVAVGTRFAERRSDAGPRARDLEAVASSPLLTGLEPSEVLSTLAACVEVEVPAGEEVPCAVANDRVAYIILEGLVEVPSGRTLGSSGMLLAESLLDIPVRGRMPVVTERTRLIRIRHDDFTEVCSHNTALAAELYKRLARHLART
jgi:serine/threonine protein phosphatase PrpC